MKPHAVNLSNNFISGWYIDSSIHDELIEYFKNSDLQHAGTAGNIVDKSIKDSMDCKLLDKNLSDKYFFQNLKLCIDEYTKIYPYCNNYRSWGIVEHMNIQQYMPTGGYFQWHTERTGSETLISSRHLVFMTYLNDVNNAGETEFFHQKLKIKPEKGLTIIWPADWTFTHRGIPSPTQEKYIITGWLNYVD
jgi:hypothetical protein